MKFATKISAIFVSFLLTANVVFAGVLDGKKIVIDAGHGGKDFGAIAQGVREKDLNISIVDKLSKYLSDYGAEVVFTRSVDNDVFIELSDRVKIANSQNADLFISIHNNSATPQASGVEVFYSSSRPNISNKKYVEFEGNRYEYVKEESIDGVEYVYVLVNKQEVKLPKNNVKIVNGSIPYQALESQEMAKMIVDNLSSLGFKNRGAKDKEYYVIKYTTMPSVLVECGFMTNPDELKKLVNPQVQDDIAKKIAESIANYYEKYEKNKEKLGDLKPKEPEIALSSKQILLGQSIDLWVDNFTQNEEYLYKVEIKRSNRVVFSSDYVQENRFNFTPNLNGVYQASIFIKHVDSENEYDYLLKGTFSVVKLPEITSINISPEKLKERKSVFIKVEKTGGSLKGADYIFEIYKDEKLITSKTTKEDVLEFTPSAFGEYKAVIKIKDSLSQNEYDDLKEMAFNVEKDVEVSRGSNPPAQSFNKVNITRVLKKGMSGTDVLQLQQALKDLGYFKYKTVTTYFGTVTETSVKNFQRANRLPVSGVVDKRTVDRINTLLAAKSNNT